MSAELKPFLEKLLLINPSYHNVFGMGMPGMGGAAPTTSGSSAASTDIIYQLHREAAALGRSMHQGDSPQTVNSVEKIEGYLLTLQVIGVLTDKQADSLLDELHDLTAK